MLPTREPICRALLDQTLARGVFRLNKLSRTILSRWKPLSVGFELVLHRLIEDHPVIDKCRSLATSGLWEIRPHRPNSRVSEAQIVC